MVKDRMAISSEDLQHLSLEDLFEHIVATYQRLLYRIAFCILDNRESAFEVVQDTLESAYKELSTRPLTWRQTLKIQSWLCTIVGHKAHTKRTHENYFEIVSLDSPEIEGCQEFLETKLEPPDVACEREETAQEVYLLLSGLSLDDRFLLKNRFVDRLDYKTLEARYNLPAGNARVRIHRILNELRKGLEAKGIRVENLEMWTGWDAPLYAHIPYDISDFAKCGSLRDLRLGRTVLATDRF